MKITIGIALALWPASVIYAALELVLLIALVGVMFSPLVALIIYRLAHVNICYTMVPQGEFIVVMHADKVHKYIGNVNDHWIDPETGKVTKGVTPSSVKMPGHLWGIYWLGFWPYASRYTYRFPRAKYVKKAGEETEYAIIGKDDTADSVFWQASYGIEVTSAETRDGVPITLQFVITTQTVHVGIALFANKSPGWLERVTAAVKAEIRDFVGNMELAKINEIKAENGSADGKSDLQKEIELLNMSTQGNPGLEETAGQKIIAINFLGYSIDTTGLNPAQEASLARYYAQRKADATVVAAQGSLDASRLKAEETKVTGEADARVITVKGNAEAGVIAAKGAAEAEVQQLLSDAVKHNPQAVGLAIAASIGKLTGLKSGVFGSNVMPTIDVDASTDEKEKPTQEGRRKGGTS